MAIGRPIVMSAPSLAELGARCTDRRFRRSVEVPEPPAAGQQAVGDVARQRLARGDHLQAGPRREARLEQHAPQGRRRQQRGGLRPLGQRHQLEAGEDGLGVGQNDAAAVIRGMKSSGTEASKVTALDATTTSSAVISHRRRHGAQSVGQRPMADLDALRRARRPRCEEHVGRGVRRHARQLGIGSCGLASRACRGEPRRRRARSTATFASWQTMPSMRALAAIWRSRSTWLADVERHIGMADFMMPEQADEQREDRSTATAIRPCRAGLACSRALREHGRPAVELGVRHRSRAVDCRPRCPGVRAAWSREQVVDAALGG